MSPNTAAERLLDTLATVTGHMPRQSGGQWQARCPAHEDRNPSLSVRPIEGSVLLHCHAGCRSDDVLAALNLTSRDLYDEPRGKELARYVFTDAAGHPTRTVHRLDGKRFIQSGDKAQVQLYRLPRVVEAVRAGQTVYLVEGEKDVHAIEALGAVATTAPMGAVNFGQVDVSPLKGAAVVAVADRDAAGEKWAAAVRDRLDGYAARLDVVEAKTGKDAADHIAAGHGLDDFTGLAGQPAAPARRLKLTPASEIEPEPVIWAWEPDPGEGRIPAGALTLAAGREGTGKSSFGIWLAAQLTRGTLPGSFYGQPRAVFYAAVEDSWSRTLVPRLMAAGADLSRVYRLDVESAEHGETMISLPLDCSLVESAIREYRAAALIIDPLMSTLGAGTDAHRTQDVRMALEPVVRMAERTACLTLGIAHFNKASGTDASQLISGSGAFKDLARAVLAFARDRESGEQVMTQTKNSLGRLDLPSYGYLIESVDVDTPKGVANVGRLVFTGPTERSVEDTLAATGSGPDADDRDEAQRWLADFMAGKDAAGVAASEVFTAAEKDGISRNALKRAKKKAGVVSQKSGGTGAGWVWMLAANATDGDDEEGKGAKGAKGAGSRDRAPLAPLGERAAPLPSTDHPASPPEVDRPTCSQCGQRLLLVRPGRDTCARCEHAAAGDVHPGCEAA